MGGALKYYLAFVVSSIPTCRGLTSAVGSLNLFACMQVPVTDWLFHLHPVRDIRIAAV